MLTMEHNITTAMIKTTHPGKTIRPPVYTTRVQYRSKEIPFLDHLQGYLNDNALTKDTKEIQTKIWDEERPLDIKKSMLFNSKHILQRVVRNFRVLGNLRLLCRQKQF